MAGDETILQEQKNGSMLNISETGFTYCAIAIAILFIVRVVNNKTNTTAFINVPTINQILNFPYFVFVLSTIMPITVC